MLFEQLKNAIDNSFADDEKLIRVQGVRDGRSFVIYEAWTNKAEGEFVISVAEEGSRDYERVMFEEEERKRKQEEWGYKEEEHGNL